VAEIVRLRIRDRYQITGTALSRASAHHSAGYQAQCGDKLIIADDETYRRNGIGQEKPPIDAAEQLVPLALRKVSPATAHGSSILPPGVSHTRR
jgi:hypothetical protein